MTIRRTKPPVLLPDDDSEVSARDTFEQLFRAWADRRDIPVDHSVRAIFDAMLQKQREFGWLN